MKKKDWKMIAATASCHLDNALRDAAMNLDLFHEARKESGRLQALLDVADAALESAEHGEECLAVQHHEMQHELISTQNLSTVLLNTARGLAEELEKVKAELAKLKGDQCAKANPTV